MRAVRHHALDLNCVVPREGCCELTLAAHTPPPPYLAGRARNRTPAHLVDNGGRMTVIMKLLDSVMVCIVYPVLPVKKVLLVLRTTLRIVLGPPPQGQSNLARAARHHRRASGSSTGSGGGGAGSGQHGVRSGSAGDSDNDDNPSKRHPFRTKRRVRLETLRVCPPLPLPCVLPWLTRVFHVAPRRTCCMCCSAQPWRNAYCVS